jgi:hypothetical protein
MKPTDADIEILRAISLFEAVTPNALWDTMPDASDPKKAMERLWSNHFLDRELVHSKPALYRVSAKGRRLLLVTNAQEGGQIAAPRNGIPMDTYTGEKPIYTRPGSDDFLKVPSRRGDSTVEWERPFIICAKVEPVGVRG